MSKQGYECTIEGEYYANTPNGQILKQYTVKAVVPQIVNKAGHSIALGLIVKHLLERLLKKKYEDYAGYRSHELIKTIDLAFPKGEIDNIDFKSRPQILALIDKNQWPISPEIYPILGDLRQAVKAYKEDPEAFMKIQAMNGDNHQRQLEEVNTRKLLEQLNPDISEYDEDYDPDSL